MLVAAVVVGLPMGVLIGARIWQDLTDRLDLVSPRRVLSLHLAIVIAIVLLLTVAIGATTHRWRARTAQSSLRAE